MNSAKDHMEEDEDDHTNVKVALRIRPASAREVIEGCANCTQVLPGSNQVQIGTTHAFTYDCVFDTDSNQYQVFDLIKPLLEGTLRGYNATILAYGQTGSGKTYTMGTGFELSSNGLSEQIGIIPRAVDYLFSRMDEIKHQQLEEKKPVSEFTLTTQFIELYNEDVIDLVDSSNKGHRRANEKIKIHEDINGQIYLNGVTTKEVRSAQETLDCLRNGALGRTTASTNMNDSSSRSHAIFTLVITQRRFVMMENGDGSDQPPDFESLNAKFHFVDLAGSERLKRTLAEGARAKEAIAINSGLLALGNVISALGDRAANKQHIPYRDSKLTRLLQDSLGGNSRTLMIACVSPSDRDFVETLNTLKYANRAKNIKNKVVINQDKSSRTIALLKLEINQLKLELLDYKQGKRTAESNNDDSISDQYNENLLLNSELNRVRDRLKAMQETIDVLNTKNAQLLAEKHYLTAGQSEEKGFGTPGDEDQNEYNIVVNYLKEIEDLRSKLLEANSENTRLRSKTSHILSPCPSSRPNTAESVLSRAKEEVQRDRELLTSRSSKHKIETDSQESGESDQSDSEDESEGDGELNAQIMEMNDEISTKQQLIEQLEQSQRRMDLMRHQYEEKLGLLLNKIKLTEEERDKMLSSFKGEGNANAKSKIRSDYEKKLKDMEAEVGKLKGFQKEHNKMMRNNNMNERMISKLKAELDQMKRNKVKLMNQLRDDNLKAREQENKRVKEIAQLKKEQRKKDIALKNLESQSRLKDQILKRKHEELNHMKKQANLLKGRGLKKSPVKAKNAWSKLKNTLSKNLSAKMTSNQMENEMELMIGERDQLVRQLGELIQSKEDRIEGEDDGEIEIINEDIQAIQMNLDYLEGKIRDIQDAIVQLEINEELEPALVNGLNRDEMHYLVSRMYNESFIKSYEDDSIKRKMNGFEEESSALRKENKYLAELLSYVLQKNPELYVENDEILSQLSQESTLPITEGLFAVPMSRAPSARSSARKARRLTSTPQELLIGPSNGVNNKEFENGPNSNRLIQRRNTFVVPAPSGPPPSGKNSASSSTSTSSNSTTTRPFTNHNRLIPATSSSSKLYNNNNHEHFDTTFICESRDPDNTIINGEVKESSYQLGQLPASPSLSRKNVFQRLAINPSDENQMTSSMIVTNNNVPKNTNIRSQSAHSQQSNTNFPSQFVTLKATASAEGHSKCVQSLVLNRGNELISGSKDTTIKVWDLVKKEIKCDFQFAHNSPVQSIVVFDENVILASSGSILKAFDLRERNVTCIATMLSSGNRSISVAADRLNTEYTINAMAVAQNSLFTTYNDRIRLWDIRKYSTIGLLAGKHNSAIMAMAIDSNRLVSGSKDHYIKVYDIAGAPSLESIMPRSTLEPPHYDGIECLLLVQDRNNTLYSGSRDNCIKKWDLRRNELNYSINMAHSNWVTGLTMFNDYLISSCRDGYLKVWNHSYEDLGNKKELSKIEAHKGAGVYSLACNNELVFTGSSEGIITFWRMDSGSSY